MPLSRGRRRASAVTNKLGVRNVTTSVTPEVEAVLDAECRERGISKSVLLRELIAEHVSSRGSQ